MSKANDLFSKHYLSDNVIYQPYYQEWRKKVVPTSSVLPGATNLPVPAGELCWSIDYATSNRILMIGTSLGTVVVSDTQASDASYHVFKLSTGPFIPNTLMSSLVNNQDDLDERSLRIIFGTPNEPSTNIATIIDDFIACHEQIKIVNKSQVKNAFFKRLFGL